MKLTRPTDFQILEVLSGGERNNAVNIAYEIDKNRSYINTRLPVLADYGLIRSVGPAPNSGLYQITEKGRVAVDLQDRYGEAAVDFDSLIAQELSNRD
ncbi:ArsR family transcriptional regulator [Natrinema sp. 1APR25-10V2]|uniref:ArsR family transcriptional regulator n=1 Tax=Natrinema sp. 1APR25-10V2 TaxID=2951081 RepID=UPI002874EA69|nr:ArsR family transcriptional regulator [Natrinema sp. 1APR25-10V2]MDS0475677.1 winged helix-turn-helix domain-containing protein [Natrinema sp. 1APR25-10V2]